MRCISLGLLITAFVLPVTGFAIDAQFKPDEPRNSPNAAMNNRDSYGKLSQPVQTAKIDRATDGEEIYTIEIKVKKMKNT